MIEMQQNNQKKQKKLKIFFAALNPRIAAFVFINNYDEKA